MKGVVLEGIKVLSMMKILAVFYATFGIIIGGIWSVISILKGSDFPVVGTPFGVWSILILPVIYCIIGGLIGIIFGVLYNLFAGWFGGLELVVSSSEESKEK